MRKKIKIFVILSLLLLMTVSYRPVHSTIELKSLIIWNYQIGDATSSTAISSDGRYLAAAAKDGSISFFHGTSSSPFWRNNTGNAVETIAMSADGQYIAAGNAGGQVLLFNQTSAIPLWNYVAGGSTNDVDISTDGRLITAGGNDKTVYIFYYLADNPLWFAPCSGNISSVAISSCISPSQWNIVAGTINGYIYYIGSSPQEPPIPGFDLFFTILSIFAISSIIFIITYYKRFLVKQLHIFFDSLCRK